MVAQCRSYFGEAQTNLPLSLKARALLTKAHSWAWEPRRRGFVTKSATVYGQRKVSGWLATEVFDLGVDGHQHGADLKEEPLFFVFREL